MIGSVAKIDEKLVVIIKMKNFETAGSMSYDRLYWYADYDPECGDFEAEVKESKKLKVVGQKLPVEVLYNKKPYTKYGESNIRGVEKVYFERIWEEIKFPER